MPAVPQDTGYTIEVQVMEQGDVDAAGLGLADGLIAHDLLRRA